MKLIILLFTASSALAIPYNKIAEAITEMSPEADIKAYDHYFDSISSKNMARVIVETQRLIHKSSVKRNKAMKNLFDCDDFARVFKSVFALQSLQDNRNYMCATIVVRNEQPFGGISAKFNPIHMLNLVLLGDTLYVIEPQTMKSVPFSDYVNRHSIIEATL